MVTCRFCGSDDGNDADEICPRCELSMGLKHCAVVAWVERQEYMSTEGYKVVERPFALMWRNRATDGELRAAEQYAREVATHINTTKAKAFAFPIGTKDPLGDARREISK